MKYLLDTDICIFYLKNEFNILEKIERLGVENCYVSEITLLELTFGAYNSSNITALHHEMVMVTHNVKHYNRIEGINIEDWVDPTYNEFIA